MSEANKRIIRKIREEAVGRSGPELDILDGLFADNYRYHGGTPFGDIEGPNAFRMLLEGFASVLDGYRETVVDQVAERNRVATRISGRGRAIGELLGAPGNGREITVSAFSLATFNDLGQLQEEWVEVDAYGILKQLAAL